MAVLSPTLAPTGQEVEEMRITIDFGLRQTRPRLDVVVVSARGGVRSQTWQPPALEVDWFERLPEATRAAVLDCLYHEGLYPLQAADRVMRAK